MAGGFVKIPVQCIGQWKIRDFMNGTIIRNIRKAHFIQITKWQMQWLGQGCSSLTQKYWSDLRDSNDRALYEAYYSKTSVDPIYLWDDEMIPRDPFWIEVAGQLGQVAAGWQPQGWHLEKVKNVKSGQQYSKHHAHCCLPTSGAFTHSYTVSDWVVLRVTEHWIKCMPVRSLLNIYKVLTSITCDFNDFNLSHLKSHYSIFDVRSHAFWLFLIPSYQGFMASIINSTPFSPKLLPSFH